MWSDFYSRIFNKSQRRAALTLVALLAIGAIVMIVNPFHKDSDDVALQGKAVEVLAPATVPVPSRPTTPFDPNTADSTTMRAYGLSAFVAANIVKYREAGGSYHSTEDLRRIYGMTDEMMARVAPYVKCPPREQPSSSVPVAPDTSKPFFAEAVTAADSLPHIEKNALGQLTDLSAADTTALQHIPGIGPVRAQNIVRHREQLGGFVRMEQLWEVPGMPEELGDWVTVTPLVTRKLRVNHDTYDRLKAHPYMGHYRAKDIMDYRRQHGSLVSLQQLALLPHFSEDDLKRLEPYLDFQ